MTLRAEPLAGRGVVILEVPALSPAGWIVLAGALVLALLRRAHAAA